MDVAIRCSNELNNLGVLVLINKVDLQVMENKGLSPPPVINIDIPVYVAHVALLHATL